MDDKGIRLYGTFPMFSESMNGHESHETFEQIVIGRYGGNLSEASRQFGVSENNLGQIINGVRDPWMFFPGTIRKIAAMEGQDPAILFPTSLYRRSLYKRLYDTPGYKILKDRYHLVSIGRWTEGEHPTLYSLFREKGLENKDYVLFSQIIIGKLSCATHTDFCGKIADALGVSKEKLFPPSDYGHGTQKRFRGISGTPAFRILEETHSIESGSSKPRAGDMTFFSLCRERGLTKSEASWFRCLLLGQVATRVCKKFCQRMAEVFEVLMDDLFPCGIYGQEVSRVPFRSLSVYIDDNASAQNLLERAWSQDTELLQEERRASIQALLLHVHLQQRETLELRYGLADGRERTLEEVGTILGLTRQRIEQIEKMALRRLREALADDPHGYRALFTQAGRNADRIAR